jgi:hypothetical protein
MDDSTVLIEATDRSAVAADEFAKDASELLVVAHFKPVRETSPGQEVKTILHQIWLSPVRSADKMEHYIRSETAKALKRHPDAMIVFCAPRLNDIEYVSLAVKLSERNRSLELTNRTSDAVVRIVGARYQKGKTQVPESKFVMDRIPGIESLGNDLRDDVTGKLDARKISDLFGINMASIARASKITRQALDENPVSEKAQSVLRLFERVARLRSLPEFAGPAEVRKWFRRPLPIFKGHSAEELFAEGKLKVVAEKVDQLLTGDFSG